MKTKKMNNGLLLPAIIFGALAFSHYSDQYKLFTAEKTLPSCISSLEVSYDPINKIRTCQTGGPDAKLVKISWESELLGIPKASL